MRDPRESHHPRRGTASVQPGGPLPAVGEVPSEIAELGAAAVAVYHRVTAESRGLRAILGVGDVEGLAIYCSAVADGAAYRAAIEDPTGGQYAHLPPGTRVAAAQGCRVIRERFLREWTRRLQAHQQRRAEGPKPAGRARTGRPRGTGSALSQRGRTRGADPDAPELDDVPWAGGRVQ